MPYNFETASGDIYFGNNLIKGLGLADPTGGITGYANLPESGYTGWVGDINTGALGAYVYGRRVVSQTTDAVSGAVNSYANNTAGIAGNAAGSFLGGFVNTAIFPGLLLFGGYLVAKKQKWL